MLRLGFPVSLRFARALSTSNKPNPPPPTAKKPPARSQQKFQAPIPPHKPAVKAFQPIPAATTSTPYRVNEYYAFNQYSFFDLGAKKQALRNPQPSPKHY